MIVVADLSVQYSTTTVSYSEVVYVLYFVCCWWACLLTLIT